MKKVLLPRSQLANCKQILSEAVLGLRKDYFRPDPIRILVSM